MGNKLNYKNYEIAKIAFVETIIGNDNGNTTIEHKNSHYYEIENKFYDDAITYDDNMSSSELWLKKQRLQTGHLTLDLAKMQIDELI